MKSVIDFVPQRSFRRSWVTSLLRIGCQRPLEIDDIFEILPDDRTEPWIDRLEK